MKNIVKYYGKILFCVLVVFGPHRAYAALPCNISSAPPLECAGVTILGSPSGCTSYALNGVYHNDILVGCYFDCAKCSSGTTKTAFATYSECSGSQRYYYCDSNLAPACRITFGNLGYCGTNSDCSGMPDGRTQCSSDGCCVVPSSPSCIHGSCTQDADCTESGYESCNLSTGCCIMTTHPIENCLGGKYLYRGECVDCPTASASTMNPVFYRTQGLTVFPVTKSAGGATSITECYISPGTYYTSAGTATLSSNCYYSF